LDVAAGLALHFGHVLPFCDEVLNEKFLEMLVSNRRRTTRGEIYSGEGDHEGGVVGADGDIWVYGDDLLDSCY
jgi:hypothetical protein